MRACKLHKIKIEYLNKYVKIKYNNGETHRINLFLGTD